MSAGGDLASRPARAEEAPEPVRMMPGEIHRGRLGGRVLRTDSFYDDTRVLVDATGLEALGEAQ